MSKSSGQLLALLTASFYVLFTLIPESHSLMITWPWVFIWQVGLLCPVFWLISLLWQGKFVLLGNHLDGIIAFFILGLIISNIFAEFPNQALWHFYKPLGLISALYSLNYYVNTNQNRYRLLIAQGYLNLAFIIISLFLWTTSIYLPELTRLNELKQYGINLSFDLNQLELRNGIPFGHQNYVAGYLLLALPVLIALSILQKGWRRWLWLTGIALALVDFYTTNSRGGFLGLVVFVIVSLTFLLLRRQFSFRWLGLGTMAIAFFLLVLGLSNQRLQNAIAQIFSGQTDGESSYRLINITIGWKMGISHLFSGVGLGGVPLLYQKYLPVWGGRESELAFQLHSTPAQIWAELGLWGIITGLGLLICLTLISWRFWQQDTLEKTDRVLLICLYAGFLGYAAIALLDYQLDNIAISGSLVVFVATIAAICRQETIVINPKRIINLIATAIIIPLIIWLIPVHWAWQLSSQGFLALAEKNIETFITSLTKAKQLIPWDPYYPYQLGFNLGNIALQNPDKQQQLFAETITNLEEGVKTAPYWELGYTNLAWLSFNNPQISTKYFLQTAELLPVKRGLWFGLGLSLLRQKKVDLAVESFTLEALREPLFISSPIWKAPTLQAIYPQIIAKMTAKYSEFIAQDNDNAYWHQSWGGLSWWLGDLATASKEIEAYGTPLSKVVVKLSQGLSVNKELAEIPESSGKLVIAAWLNSAQRQQLLQQAWILKSPIPFSPKIEQDLINGMTLAANFREWLQLHPLVFPYRREREGFGNIANHLDGLAPLDFWTVIENTLMTNWFDELLPSPITNRQLDIILQPEREKLLQAIKN